MKQAGKAAGAGRVLNAVAMAILWLAGAAGGWAAESAAGTHAGGGEAPFLNAWLLLGSCPGGEDESPLASWSCNGAEFINTGRKIPWTVEDGKVVRKLDGMQPDPVVSVIRLSVVVSRQ